MLLILLVEYFTIRYKIEVLEEIEEKKDYARSAQLSGQQIALLVQQYLNGQTEFSAEILSRVDEQDRILRVIRDGGRMDGTDIFLEPLSRLPKISFDELQKAWEKYRANVQTLLLPSVSPPSPVDSSAAATTAATVKARGLIAAQWLTLSNWYKKLEIDLTEEADEKKNSVENWVLAFIALDFALLGALFYLFVRYVINPIEKIEHNASSHHQDPDIKPNEIGNLTRRVNEILEQLKDATDFVGGIGEGKLDFDYKNLDSEYAQGKNKLADSLISMQSKLKEMNIEEQRRQWANDGLTKFVDILRTSNDNINSLGDRIISGLVQYTGSNQGGLYILNDDDTNNRYLELVSMFAFNTKKFEKQKIKPGEGILGQTYLEKETTLLTEIPDEYIRITSGLGEANPKALLVVPLKVDKEVYGIVELASFRHYQPHEIAFVEKLAETIASTLASVKAAQKNRQLIEQFQQQTEEMRAQEEEMRQNMEELQATQEEMSRKERDYVSRIHELEGLSGKANQAEQTLKALQEEFSRKENALKDQLRQLDVKLAQKIERSDDWEVATDIEKALRIQIEALRITQEELNKKQ